MIAKEPPIELGAKPFSAFEWMLAGRYLKPGRKDAVITLIAGFSFLGIMLGVATLIVVMSVMNGFRTELTSKILAINGHITVQPIDGPLRDYREVADRIAVIDDVTLAMPYVQGQALASGRSQSSGILVRGVWGDDLKELNLVGDTLIAGTLDDFDQARGLAIGSRLARQMGVRVGDMLTIVTPEGNITPMGTTPRVKAYPIEAVFEIGMSEYDSLFVFMPFEEAQLFFNQEGVATAIDVYTVDPDRVGAFRQPVEDATERSVYLTDWRQQNLAFFSALEVERNMMFLILTMIVLVAALNIVSGLTMLVREKRRDIAILRTMGATRAMILRIFLMTGMSIGVIGTLAGLVLGITIALNAESIRQFISWFSTTTPFPPEVYLLSRLPSDIDSGETVSVVIMAITLSFLATLQPALKAASLDPVAALRTG